MNIATQNVCIKRLITVIKNQNHEFHKLLSIKGRHSDAVVYILEGRCTYSFDNGTKFDVSQGDVLYLPHQSVYTMYIHTTAYRFIFCDFEFEDDTPRHGSVYRAQTMPEAHNLFEKLFRTYTAGGTYADCMAALYAIYGMIQRGGSPATNRKASMVHTAKGEMDARFKDPSLSIASVAESANMSEVYFRKLFKSLYGVSPARYLTITRLEYAKTLMGYPFLTLAECAVQSGFSSQQYFNRVFKQEMGLSPGQYRKEKTASVL